MLKNLLIAAAICLVPATLLAELPALPQPTNCDAQIQSSWQAAKFDRNTAEAEEIQASNRQELFYEKLYELELIANDLLMYQDHTYDNKVTQYYQDDISASSKYADGMTDADTAFSEAELGRQFGNLFCQNGNQQDKNRSRFRYLNAEQYYGQAATHFAQCAAEYLTLINQVNADITAAQALLDSYEQ